MAHLPANLVLDNPLLKTVMPVQTNNILNTKKVGRTAHLKTDILQLTKYFFQVCLVVD